MANVNNKQVYNVTAKFIYKEAKEEINRRNYLFCREEKGEFKKAISVRNYYENIHCSGCHKKVISMLTGGILE